MPAGGSSCVPGAAATLMVRPERLDISASAPTHPVGGTLSATLVERALPGLGAPVRGPHRRGTVLVAHVHVDDMPDDVQPGRPVTLSWLPEGAYLVDEAIDVDTAGVTTIDSVGEPVSA